MTVSPADDLAIFFCAMATHRSAAPSLLIDSDRVLLEVNDAARDLDAGLAPGARLVSVEGWTVEALDQDGRFRLLSFAGTIGSGEREAGPEDVRDQLLRQFFGTDGMMFIVCDATGRVIKANDEWIRIVGSFAEETPPSFWDLVQTESSDSTTTINYALATRSRCRAHLRLRSSDGSSCETDWSLSLDTTTGLLFGVGRDVTAQARMTEELERLAFTDSLTGLANRARIVRVIDSHLVAGRAPGVLFCDLDRFKVVNDSLGHQAGDRLLQMLAERLVLVCQNDTRADRLLVGRLGGDEFVVVMASTNEAGAARLAARFLERMNEPFVLNGRQFRIGMSIGIAVAIPGRSSEAELLLSEADTAAYHAKDQRRGGFVIHDEDLQTLLGQRFDIEAGLVRALYEERFEVHYQPILEIASGAVRGVEALVRWRDDHGILQPPASFVAIAEEAGLIGDIDDFVLSTATREAAAIGRDDFGLSINATAGQISNQQFVDRVRTALDNSGFDPHRLTLELTESAMLSDMDSTIPVMNALRELGVRIAIDDFGTGYSSLSYLRELPIDIVKIDRSFVQSLATDHVAQSVVAAVLGLARALDLNVVVEGIETVPQLEMAQQLGCELAQGFLFHQPMPADELQLLLTPTTTPHSRVLSGGVLSADRGATARR